MATTAPASTTPAAAPPVGDKANPRHLVLFAAMIVGQFMATFQEFPPRQKPSSFSVEQVMDLLGQPSGGEGVGTRALQ